MSATAMCQAGLTSAVEREVESELPDRPFRLCAACATRFENLALRPLEWYRLAASHGPLCYLLHDDFYSQDGQADQNQIPVKLAALFPAPRLETVETHLSALLDYTITRWNLDEQVVAALHSHSKEHVLAGRFSASDNPDDSSDR